MTELSGKSREHLTRCAKKYLKSTPSEIINELRLNYAANLLITTTTPIIDICFASGFGSVGYFYEVFKRKEGLSPKDFRNKYSKLKET